MSFVKALKEQYKKKPWLMSFFTVFTLIAATISLIWLSNWHATERMISIANQFRPDQSWTLEADRMVAIGNPCLGNCPGVSRLWRLQDPIRSAAEFQKIAILGSIPMEILNDCFSTFSIFTSKIEDTKSCTATFHKNGFYVMLSYSGYEEPAYISLRVQPE